MDSIYICHYGVGHLKGGNSGRYKWGTGEKWAKKTPASKKGSNYYRHEQTKLRMQSRGSSGAGRKAISPSEWNAKYGVEPEVYVMDHFASDENDPGVRKISDTELATVKESATNMATGLQELLDTTQIMRHKGNKYLQKAYDSTGDEILETLTSENNTSSFDKQDLEALAKSAQKVADSFRQILPIINNGNLNPDNSFANKNDPGVSAAEGVAGIINTVSRDSEKYWSNIASNINDVSVIDVLNEFTFDRNTGEEYANGIYGYWKESDNRTPEYNMLDEEFGRMVQGSLQIADSINAWNKVKE